jgi:hypothetical protein
MKPDEARYGIRMNLQLFKLLRRFRLLGLLDILAYLENPSSLNGLQAQRGCEVIRTALGWTNFALGSGSVESESSHSGENEGKLGEHC